MTPPDFLARVLDPSLAFLQQLGGPVPTRAARHILLAIALQESGPALAARYQNSPSATPGPAKGFWQFEAGGGVVGVLNHAASRDLARKACAQCEVVSSNNAAVHRAI